MGKSVHNDVLDAALQYIIDNCDEMDACATEPTTYTEAITTNNLADAAMVSGDFTIADGDTNGRKVTIAAQNGETVDTSGTADHIALVDTSNTKLLYVTTCTSQGLTSGSTVNFGAWDIEIADPT